MEFNQGFSNEDGTGKSDKKVSNSKTTYKGELSFDLKNSVLSESDNSVITLQNIIVYTLSMYYKVIIHQYNEQIV